MKEQSAIKNKVQEKVEWACIPKEEFPETFVWKRFWEKVLLCFIFIFQYEDGEDLSKVLREAVKMLLASKPN